MFNTNKYLFKGPGDFSGISSQESLTLSATLKEPTNRDIENAAGSAYDVSGNFLFSSFNLSNLVVLFLFYERIF